jgi:Domain of unknown function DUF302
LIFFALFAVKPLIYSWKLKAVTPKDEKNFRLRTSNQPTSRKNQVRARRLNLVIERCGRRTRNFKEISVPSLPDNGMVHLSSPYPVAETIKRMECLLHVQGLTEFCRLDHSGEAEKAGLKMHPTQVIIFGSPKGGTPLMTAAPTVAIDAAEGIDLGRWRWQGLGFL